jgi:long-chain acyl-CoA synthetase
MTNPSPDGNDVAASASDSSIPGVWQLARRDPSRIAIIEADGETITVQELVGRINRLSNAFRDRGYAPGGTVAGLLHNSATYFEVTLATFQTGMRFVPINTRSSAQEVRYICSDSGADILIADDDLAAGLGGLPDLPRDRIVLGNPVRDWISYCDLTQGQRDTEPDDRTAGSIMAYTSGTTGRPKGVDRTFSGLAPEMALTASYGFMRRFGFHADGGTHLVCSPLYHAAPSGFSTTALHVGQTLILHRHFDAKTTLAAITEHHVTNTHMVPTHFHRLLALDNSERRRADTASLEFVVHAAAPCPVETKRAMMDWWGPILWEYLGATEGLVSVISPQEWLAHPGSVGKPDGVLLLDDDGNETAPGGEGTIYFAVGPEQFSYHNDAEKTAAARHGDYITVGDVGRLDTDGYLYVLDRRTDLILSGGVNIYPSEIEAVLIQDPAVTDVAVIGVPHDDWGQAVVAVVEIASGFVADEAMRRRLLEACSVLASYKRPRYMAFTTSLPRSETGKINRRILRSSYGYLSLWQTR